MNRLEKKLAVIYGDGAVGAAVSKAFARENARIFLAGRTKSRIDAIANDIGSAGGTIETTVLDALDEKAVEDHMEQILMNAGKVDISFNTIGISQMGIQGIPLTELPLNSFSLPIAVYTNAHFITARAAARRMTSQGFGVILMHTPNASRISPPFVGGMVPAWAGIEALCRSLSVECGPFGLRTICILTTGIPETPLIDEVWKIHGKAHGISFEQFHTRMESMTHRKKLTTLNELSNAAIFAASDEGAAITGTVLNLTAGMIVN